MHAEGEMRSIACGLLLLLGLPCSATAQTQTEGLAPKEVPAKEITLDDLRGMTVYASSSFTARFRNSNGEASGGYTSNWEIGIGPLETTRVKYTRDAWWNTPAGRKTGHRSSSDAGTIGLPSERKDGAALLLLENNTLTLLRVYQVGGGILKVSLQKDGTHLTCSAAAKLLQEVGAGATTTPANVEGGGKIQVRNERHISSTCKIRQTK